MILGKFARLSLAIAATGASATAPAPAGGVIGWATAVNDFSTEGTAVGAAAVILGMLGVGAILMFGITGLITTVVMVCLGGALMAKAHAVGQSLFGAAGGGGSIHHVRVAPPPGVVPTAVTLPSRRF